MSLTTLQVKKMRIEKLTFDKKNARKHGPASIEALKRSLVAFGQQKPIVVTADGKIVAGHGTVTAAEELGWSDIDVVVTKLQGADAKAFGLMDNKSAELSDWDQANLGTLLHELREEDYEIADTGFDLEDFDFEFGDKAPPKQVTKEVTFNVGEGGDGLNKAAEPKAPPPPPTDVVVNFTAEGYAEFGELAKFLQAELQIPSLAELMLELMRTAKAELESPDDAV